MSYRLPLVASVVGALVIGGATTGATLALWRDGNAIPASSVTAGTISLVVDGEVDASLGSLPELALNRGTEPGAAERLTMTVANAGTGKNLLMQVELLDIAASTTALHDGLEVALGTAATETECPSSPSTGYQPVSVVNSALLSPTALRPGDSRALCLFVRVEGDAGTAVEDAEGQLNLSFRGDQVQS